MKARIYIVVITVIIISGVLLLVVNSGASHNVFVITLIFFPPVLMILFELIFISCRFETIFRITRELLSSIEEVDDDQTLKCKTCGVEISQTESEYYAGECPSCYHSK